MPTNGPNVNQGVEAEATSSAGGYAESNPSLTFNDTTASTDLLLKGGLGRGTKEFSAPLAKGPGKQKPGILASFLALRHASRRPLPVETGDGTYITKRTETGLRHDIRTLTPAKLKTLFDLFKNKAGGSKQIDDKTMIMERVIQLVADLPPDSRLRVKLTNTFLTELWDTLDHPPMNYIGDEFSYRTADGSNNNVFMPKLGAAGSTYARSVRPVVRPSGALPDPGLIFDSIMCRGAFKKNPNNVSSILWLWATIIIHDIFWTDHQDMTRSKSSSYLDLAPLYGSSQEMQDSVRTFKDGMLKPDTFADKRLLGMPPACCVILIMFNRFHNHVASNLAAINEGSRFSKPIDGPDEERNEAAWKRYDNDLFQVARLITCGLYINITLLDYVRNIINLNRVDTTWTLDPRQDMGIDAGTEEGAERGTGNIVSAEFNLCYRWHSCISQNDEQWMNNVMGQALQGKPVDEVTIHDMVEASTRFAKRIPDEPLERPLKDFKRGTDGKYSDDDLVGCITAAIEDVGGAFGARNVPKVMRPVEMLGIIQQRRWNLAGLNEFRKHFGLKPHEKFEDINSDPAVANALRQLYEHPDLVELYPGIVAEEAKDPMVPGVGITPTYTVSRVILSDAVCLVRGDRFYTTDFNPRNLTTWGYNEVNYDLNINHGCVFYKLFLRAFPQHFRQNSVYAHYPMVIPDENQRILKSLKRESLFDFSRPKFEPPRVNITSYGGAKSVLEHQQDFMVTWHEGLSYLMGESGKKFMLSGDTQFHASQRQIMAKLLYLPGWRNHVKTFYAQMGEQLLNEKSCTVSGPSVRQPSSSANGQVQGTRLCRTRMVDIIRDVGNIVHVHFAARVFNLPLKTASNPRGIYTEQELYGVLAMIFTTIFFDLDITKSFPLRTMTKPLCEGLGKLMETNAKITRLTGGKGMFVGNIGGQKKRDDPLAAYGSNMIKGLLKAGLSVHDVTWSHVVPTAGAMVPNQAEVLAQAVDFYLSDEGKVHIPALHSLATEQNPTADTDALLLGYAMEGIRLAGTFGSYREVAHDCTITEDDGKKVNVKKGDKVFVSFVSAARDPARFPNPDEVNPRRDLRSYIHYGLGPHACLGREASQVSLVEMFRCLWRRSNVRRAPGKQGLLKKVARPGGFYVYMRPDWGSMSPFPSTMKILWDEYE